MLSGSGGNICKSGIPTTLTMRTEFFEGRRQPCEFILRHTVDHALPNARNVCRSCTLEQTPTLWRHLYIGRTAVILVSHSFDQALLQHSLHSPRESTSRQSQSGCQVAQFHSSIRRFRQHRQQLVVPTIDAELLKIRFDVLQHIASVQHEAPPGSKFHGVQPTSHESSPTNPQLGRTSRWSR